MEYYLCIAIFLIIFFCIRSFIAAVQPFLLELQVIDGHRFFSGNSGYTAGGLRPDLSKCKETALLLGQRKRGNIGYD